MFRFMLLPSSDFQSPEIFFLFNFYPEDSLLYSQRYPYSQSAFGVFCCVSSAHSLQKYTDEGNSSLDVMEGSSKEKIEHFPSSTVMQILNEVIF